MWRVQHWSAGWNQAGYGVDSADLVMHGDTLDEAFDHVQSQLEYERDYTSDADEQAFIDAIDQWTAIDQREVEVQAGLSLARECVSITVNGRVYWVMACYTVGCDQTGGE